MKALLLVAIVLATSCTSQRYLEQSRQQDLIRYTQQLQYELCCGLITPDEYNDLVAGYCEFHQIKIAK